MDGCGCRLQEKHTREKLRDHLQAVAGLQRELQEVRKRLVATQSKIRTSHDRQQKLLKSTARSATTSAALLSAVCAGSTELVPVCSEEDRQFVLQSSETELVALFRNHDDLQEQQQELETRIDEMEDLHLP